MKLNIVTVSSGWILQKIAERMQKNLPAHVEGHISTSPMPGYDAYYYCDIQNCYHNYKTVLPDATHIGYITHAHEDSAEWLVKMFNAQGVWDLDGIKSMNERYTIMCHDIKYAGPLFTATPPAIAADFPLRKTKLVIANRGGFPGYGHDFMLGLPDNEMMLKLLQESYELTFVGNGWEPVVDKYEHNDIEVLHIPDSNCSYPHDYAKLYHQADYLLVPILWTAGPYCAMEAKLTGLPIISSDVGLIGYEVAADYVYPPGDSLALLNILSDLSLERFDRRMDVIEEVGDWKSYTAEVIGFIEGVKDAG
jgi:hypothetical protein